MLRASRSWDVACGEARPKGERRETDSKLSFNGTLRNRSFNGDRPTQTHYVTAAVDLFKHVKQARLSRGTLGVLLRETARPASMSMLRPNFSA
jgi:hypothetical protein